MVDDIAAPSIVEVLLLVGKMVLFCVENYLYAGYIQQKPEALMTYPGLLYYLNAQIIVGPLVYGIVIAVRLFRSKSLRQYMNRRLVCNRFNRVNP